MIELDKAMARLVWNHAFDATIIHSLTRVLTTTAQGRPVKTMATDGKHLYINPEFFKGLSEDLRVTGLQHEARHVAGMHPLRRNGRDPDVWNDAADAVVNGQLGQEGAALGTTWVPGVLGASVEEEYNRRHQPKPEKPEANDDPPEEPDPSEDEDGGGQPGGEPDDGDGEPGDGESDDDPADQQPGEVWDRTNDDGSPLSEAEQTQAENDTRVLVQQAVAAAKRAGDLPAGLKHMIEETLEARIPWKEVLAQFMNQFVRSNYSWQRPNKRFIHTGIIMPSLWSAHIGNILPIADTSGSVIGQMKEIVSEIMGALAAIREHGDPVEQLVLWADTEVYPQTVTDAEDLVPQGGGGTDFRAVFEYVEREALEPAGIVFITDGQVYGFGPNPGVPVLWILTEPNRSFTPPFGQVAWTMDR